jgi:hypothetical protein
MRNATSVIHTHVAIITTDLSLFQMANLQSFLKHPTPGGDHNASETYIRNIINSDAEPKTMLGKSYNKRIGVLEVGIWSQRRLLTTIAVAQAL